jgi:hypothetical protein
MRSIEREKRLDLHIPSSSHSLPQAKGYYALGKNKKPPRNRLAEEVA